MKATLALSLAFFAAAPAAFSSVVLYSNFGPPGNQFTTSGGWAVNRVNQVAFGFSVSSATPLLEIALPVLWTTTAPAATPDRPLAVELIGPYGVGQQAPGAPETVIESWIFGPTGSAGIPAVQHLASTLHPVLDPSQRYFVRLSSTGLSEIFQWGWSLNNQGVGGFVVGTPGNYTFSNLTAPALEVLGEEVSGVPEPESVVLLGAGLMAGVLMRRRLGAGI